MKKLIGIVLIVFLFGFTIQLTRAALVGQGNRYPRWERKQDNCREGVKWGMPNEIQQPGTQPLEVGNLKSPDKCDNCHGGYDQAVEPAYNWRGSMMANAGRDPIFWATVAVAEQDFDGSGDLCIRCHSTGGWYGGRSTPTDGSGLAASDADGVDCDTCHKMTNTNNTEHLGVMTSP